MNKNAIFIKFLLKKKDFAYTYVCKIILFYIYNPIGSILLFQCKNFDDKKL